MHGTAPPMRYVQQLLENEDSGNRLSCIEDMRAAAKEAQKALDRKLQVVIAEETNCENIARNIGLTVTSTLQSTAPEGAPSKNPHEPIPDDILETQASYEHVLALLLAHPCYLSAVYRNMLARKGDAPSRAEAFLPKVDHLAMFSDLCISMYGDLSRPRNNHLFLVMCNEILSNAADDAAEEGIEFSAFVADFEDPNSLFGRLMGLYFSQDHNMENTRGLVGGLIEHLAERTMNNNLGLEFDPIGVYKEVEPNKKVPDNNSERERLFNNEAVSSKVMKRVNVICDLGVEWVTAMISNPNA